MDIKLYCVPTPLPPFIVNVDEELSVVTIEQVVTQHLRLHYPAATNQKMGKVFRIDEAETDKKIVYIRIVPDQSKAAPTGEQDMPAHYYLEESSGSLDKVDYCAGPSLPAGLSLPDIPKVIPESLGRHQWVKILTSGDRQSQRLLPVFFWTYRTVFRPGDVLAALLERYYVPQPIPPVIKQELDYWLTHEQPKIQLQVANVLFYWLQHHPWDFDKTMVERLEEWVQYTLSRDGYIGIQNAFHSFLSSRSFLVPTKLIDHKAILSNLCGLNTRQEAKLGFLDFTPEQMAKQLTLLCSKTFQCLHYSEFLAWTNKNERKKAPTITSMVDFFNKLSGWVTSSIINQAEISTRKFYVGVFVQLLQSLWQLRNFDAMYAVLVGIQHYALENVVNNPDTLTDDLRRILGESEALFSPDRNYKNYRDMIYVDSQPTVPYLGVILKDLTFIEENDKFTASGGSNVFRMCSLSNILRIVGMFQKLPHQIAVDRRCLEYFLSLPEVNTKLLRGASIRNSPR